MTIASKQFLYKVQYLSYFVFRAFLIAIFCLLVLLGIFFAVYFGDLFLNVKTGNYSSPIFNGYVIVSQSMVPTININDAIVVKRETNDKYNIGDIIMVIYSIIRDQYTLTLWKQKNYLINSIYIINI